MKILGLSAFYHDSAAALLVDGEIVAAAQEERFSRRKFDPAFPEQAIRFCLDRAGSDLGGIDHVVFHEKPLLKFNRIMRSFAEFAPRGFWAFRQAMPLWLGGKLWQKRQILRQFGAMEPGADLSAKLLFAEHHQSHAASAFYPSPFEEALVLTLDGVGEWATGSVCLGRGAKLTPELEMEFPASLGLLYTAITQYLGFKVLSGEYKVMGLAPYGTPRYRDLFFDHLVDLKADGSFALDQRYFDYCTGQSMISEALCDLFGQPARRGEDEPLAPFHMDVAASLQVVTEEIVLRMVRSLMQRFNQRNLCLAGGVALNCVANGRILREAGLDGLWVQPAAGDAGCALGAALAAHHQHRGQPRAPRRRDAMQGSYLGPDFPQPEIEKRLARVGASIDCHEEDARASLGSLLTAFGVVGPLDRLIARRHDAMDTAMGLSPVAMARRGREARQRLLPCDTHSLRHVPNEVRRRYGSDQSETVEYRFNAAGYRSEELDPRAKLRILIVGESHALGVGVPFERCLGQRFKSHLAQALGWREAAINVVNLSAGGASADYCARTLVRQVDIVAPDLFLCLLPVPDRIEDYTASHAKNYKVTGIDPEEIDKAPVAVQGFLDLYNIHFGRMNLAKNALLMQSICRLRGIEHIIVSEKLRQNNFRTPLLSPVYAQLDHGRILLHRLFQNRADLAADGRHAGVLTNEAVATLMLVRYAALLSAKGQTGQGDILAAYVKRLRPEGEDRGFARQAKRRMTSKAVQNATTRTGGRA